MSNFESISTVDNNLGMNSLGNGVSNFWENIKKGEPLHFFANSNGAGQSPYQQGYSPYGSRYASPSGSGSGSSSGGIGSWFGFGSSKSSSSGSSGESASSSSGGMSFSNLFNSNSILTQIVFLILVFFIFMVLLRMGISVISYLTNPNQSPHLIDGMIDAKQGLTISQNPASNGSKTVYRSVNQEDGIEFTWSVWIYINDLTYLTDKYKQIFYKGNSNIDAEGLNEPNNAPGLYIMPNTNSLVVIMNTFEKINEEIIIPDVPLNKWVNVIIRCENKNLDVFVNGTITRSLTMMGVPKQNYGDVYVAMNGGFDGYVSDLWYYNYSLGPDGIQKVINKGPNTKLIGSNFLPMLDSNYLSLRWYFGDSAVDMKGAF